MRQLCAMPMARASVRTSYSVILGLVLGRAIASGLVLGRAIALGLVLGRDIALGLGLGPHLNPPGCLVCLPLSDVGPGHASDHQALDPDM